MKHNYLKPVKCPCCENYYIIDCMHAELGREADQAVIWYKSKEYIEVKMVEEDGRDLVYK